jgi:hypothetical protein
MDIFYAGGTYISRRIYVLSVNGSFESRSTVLCNGVSLLGGKPKKHIETETVITTAADGTGATAVGDKL